MSTTIDHRVVEMEFDNKQFERNVSTTMSSIDKLKQSLNFNGTSKGMSALSDAANNTGRRFDELEATACRAGFHLEDVWHKVSTVFEYQIANRIISAGKKIVSALTIDPVKTGFSEYETQMKAVQTILANTQSKGTTLDDVNGALDELNTYADKTIYNFTEMTNNIGRFTAAGIDLDKSVSSIKGIANLAAVSGSTSQQASTAMYQLSQALSSGTLKLQDWNSVVNAGMGGQVFQDALKETARVHGVAVDDLISKHGSFRNSLQEGWITADILNETLRNFTLTVEGAEEGTEEYKREWDKLKKSLMEEGYTEKQAENILQMSKTANDAATKVKTFSQLWDTLKESAQSGWTQTWEILVGDFEEAKELLTKISDVVGGIIGKSSEARNELLENWKTMGGRNDLIESFWNIFDAIGAIVKPIKEAFEDIFPPMTAEKLHAFTEGLKNLTAKLKIGDKTAEKLKRTFKGVFAIVDIFRMAFMSVFKAVGSLFGGMGELSGGVLDLGANIGDALVAFRDFISSSKIFDKVASGIADVVKVVIKTLSRFIGLIKDKIAVPGFEFLIGVLEGTQDKMSNVTKIAETMKNGIISVFEGIGSFLESCSFVKILQGIWKIIKVVASGAIKIIGGLAKGLGNAFDSAGIDGVAGFINMLLTGGALVGLVKLIKGFFSAISDVKETVGGFFGKITGILDGVKDCLKSYQDQLKAETLKKIATAIAILAASLVVLSFIDPERLGTATATIAALFGELLISMSLMGKITSPKGVIKLTTMLMSLATSMLILSVAAKILSTLSLEEMGIALLGISVGLGVLVAAVNLLPEKKLTSSAAALRKMSVALVVLSVALKIMATMSWDEIGRGLVVMVAGLAALVGAINLLPKDTMLKTLGMTSLATALVILAGALKIMATMSWEEVAVSLSALVGTLTALVFALNLMKKALPGAAAVFIVAPALIVLAGALKIMATMSWDEIGRGLVVLAGAMAILAVSLIAMKNTIFGSLALLTAAAALAVLTPILFTLGSMSWETIAKGLIALAASLAIIGIAGALLGSVIPAIMGLGVAIALIGVGIAAAGIGLIAFGAGLSAVAVGFVAIVSALPAIVYAIISIITAIAVGVGKAIVAFCEIISEGAPAIGEAIRALVLVACEVLVECIPVIANTLLQLVASLLDSLVEYTPKIVDALFQFLIGVIEGIARNIPPLVQALFDVLASILVGAIEALQSIDPETLIKGLASVGLMLGIVAILGAIVPLIPSALVGVIGMGAVITELAIVLAAVGALAQIPGLQWLINEGGNFLQSIGEAIGKFIGGIAGGVAEGFTDSLPAIGTNLSNFMTNAQGFFDGLKNIDESTLESAMSLVKVILAITAANIIEGIASWITGESSITQFASDIVTLGTGLKGFAVAVAGIDPEAVKAAASAAKTIAEMTNTIPNSGGVVSWFAGDNSISKFAGEIPKLGSGIKAFAVAVTGINPEQVTAAANAAKTLAEMTNTIPNSGGVVSWFAGDNSVANFAAELGLLGSAIKKFSDESTGVNPEQVTAAANAAKTLAEMTNAIPNQGGVAAWFAGENSISKYANQLPALGRGLKGFANQVVDINAENVTAAAQAAQAIAEMTNHIPKEGGIKAWFTGESSVSKFADKLPTLGKGIKAFSESIVGIVPANVEAAANAAKALAEMTDHIPKKLDKIGEFGTAINGFGSKLAGYFGSMKNVTEGSINSSNKAVDAVKKLESLNADGISGSAKAIDSVTAALKNMASIPKDATSTFVTAIEKLGKASSDALLKSFEDLGSKLKKVATKAMGEFVSGLGDEGKKSSAKKACTSMVTACSDAMKEKQTSFYNAGSHLVTGFANGISENSYKAAAKAKAMAEAAVEAARKELDINSPSKVFRSMGYSIPEGLAMGIDKMGYMVTKSSESMADTAITNVGWSISRLADVVNSDIDAQPTIRPVLDLSDVKAGASSIGKMLDGTSSVGVLANVGAISAMMDKQNQNGRNSDVVSAIKDLAKDIGNNRGDTYNFGNISYDDDSSIAAAVRELVRAARIERRV